MLGTRLRFGALALCLGLLVLVAGTVAERIVAYGKILPRVEVRGAQIGGMTAEEARTELAGMAPELQTEPWEVRHGDRRFELDPVDIDYRIDPDATVADARRQGRSRNPIDQVGGAVLRLLRPDVVPLAAEWNEQRLDEALDAWADALSEGLQNGGLRFERATVVEIEPQAGVGLLRADAEAALDRQLHSASRSAIELSIGETEPEVDAAEVARAARTARSILAEPVVLTVEGNNVVLSPDDLGSTMSARTLGGDLILDIDSDALRSVLAPSIAPVETPPVDAGFAVEGTSVRVVPAQTGRIVDLDAVAKRILAGDHAITGQLRDASPARTTEWAESLNITELVSTFTTEYAAGQPRVRNIQLAAELLNDTVVEPGAVFSLNEVLGPRTAERGFVEAPAFSEEEGFFETHGGGVSQLSTTLYNATFFGGYEIIEHTPHSIYISRYPMGREATLDYPGVDNVFRNDSDSGILIRASAGPSSVTVSYFGNREGRVVESEGPNLIEEIPVEEEIVETDWLLEGDVLPVPGESGYPGLVVEYFRIIKRPGEPDERQRFTWTYDMRPRRVLVGTAPRLPEPPPEGLPPPEAPPPPEALPAPPALLDQERRTATSIPGVDGSNLRRAASTRVVMIAHGTSLALTTI